MSVALFYEKPRPLDSTRDSGLMVREITDLGYARKTNTIPLNLNEFGLAARHYPIGFVGEAGMPVAFVGLQEDNLFVDEAGRWKAGTYVPGFVRRYPFILGDSPDGPLRLCIDDTPAVISGTKGRLLFENGQPSALVKQALDFCTAYHASGKATEPFVKALKSAGLLVDSKAETRMALGARFTLAGFQRVDTEKLRKLPARTLAQWNAKDWLSPLFAHVQSMNNWSELSNLVPKVQPAPKKPAK